MMASGNEARRKLTLARDSLIQDLSPIPFLDQLIHREVVEPGEAVVDRTTAAMRQLGRTDAVRLLLDDYLQRKVAVDPSILDQLIDSLEASNQKHLAELLRRPVPPPVQAGATPGNDTTFTAVQPTGMDELDSCPPKDVAAGSELYDLSKDESLDQQLSDMTAWESDVFTELLPDLVSTLTPGAMRLQCEAKKLITRAQRQLFASNTGRAAQNEELLDALSTGDDESFHTFLECIRKVEPSASARRLLAKLEPVDKFRAARQYC